MGTLSVWRFDTPAGADEAVDTLRVLAAKQLVTVYDGATVSWPEGAKKPKTRQLHDVSGPGALGGAFWGLLFGLVFFMPLIGVLLGAAVGAISGTLRNVGISDEFIERARAEITPGTSGLFVLTRGAVVDKISQEFRGSRPHLLFTNLSQAQEDVLREAFAE